MTSSWTASTPPDDRPAAIAIPGQGFVLTIEGLARAFHRLSEAIMSGPFHAMPRPIQVPVFRCGESEAVEHVIVDVGAFEATLQGLLAELYPDLESKDIGSSTACFECGITVRTEDVWLKKSDPNIALCEGCFRKAETAGRAKERIDDGNPGR